MAGIIKDLWPIDASIQRNITPIALLARAEHMYSCRLPDLNKPCNIAPGDHDTVGFEVDTGLSDILARL